MEHEAKDRVAKLDELRKLQSRVAELEHELTDPPRPWQAAGYYASYYATTGFILGIFGAATSLLFNVVESLMVGQHPLQLIKVYLTFPLGERALSPELGRASADGPIMLAGRRGDGVSREEVEALAESLPNNWNVYRVAADA